MKNQQEPLSLPIRQPARTTALTIRLSEEERFAIEALAAHLNIPMSQMARHVLLQGVKYHTQQMQLPVSIPKDTLGGK